MDWKHDQINNCWILSDNTEIVSKIYIKTKENQINKYIVKTILQSVYLGSKKFKKLEKTGKNWYSKIRKFKTQKEVDDYIEIKKKEILKIVK